MLKLKQLLLVPLNRFAHWRWARDRRALVARLSKGSVGAEVGVWKGAFSGQLLEALQPKELHLIDPWRFFPNKKDCWYGGAVAKQQRDMDVIHDAVVNTLKERREVFIHRSTSAEAAATFKDAFFDWVYIDGDHYYDGVMSDLVNYYPKIKKGGTLCGDDLNWTAPGLGGERPVDRAVRDFVQRMPGAELRVIGTQFMVIRTQ
ncbi:MAG TPA: class I SAM-dependent methyltransferase [Flavobacteriales bacterium]|jgi:hypothetical protein|nr:class I SAM-dependent methyltransferase [Flavobacteriales bacterium]